MNKRLGLRIDVDTIHGLVHGLPDMLRILEKAGIRATIFLPTGPDVPSLTLARIALNWRRIRQMIRLRPAGKSLIQLAVAGLMTAPQFFYRILPGFRADLRHHEIALHGYDHWRWIYNVHRWSSSRINTEIRRGVERFKSVFGHTPAGFGAPGWQTTSASLVALDSFGFGYASDCRGSTPFRPRGHLTPQIPTTLPTIEDAMRLSGGDETLFRDELTHLMKAGMDHCYCAHCETEGMRFPSFFEFLIIYALEHNITVCPLGELLPHDLLPGTISFRRIPGRFESVSWQKSEPRT